MRIGFASMFAWRPHVEHLIWLARYSRKAGHDVSFLTCDAALSSCYSRELRPDRSTARTCASCIAGGVRSFEAHGVTSLRSLRTPAPLDRGFGRAMGKSSAATLGRFETQEDFESEPFGRIADRLAGPCEETYRGARRWIEHNRLEAVCVFNGRIDVTRAVFDAARDAGIRVVSLERTWFGDGLQLLPGENCLGLGAVNRLMREWRTRPLLPEQAARTAGIIATRFSGGNEREWRAYNRGAKVAKWPNPGKGQRLLFLPGSRNEVYGDPDWTSGWGDATKAYDAIIDRLGLDPQHLVLRCHPNWSERIGLNDGSISERFFTDWARARGVYVIASSEAASTQSLMDQAHGVVVAGSSAGLEAGMLGKRILAISPSIYQAAGFQTTIYAPSDLDRVERDIIQVSEEQAREIARLTLRFAHTMIYRVPQFVENVRCLTTTKYRYSEPANFGRFIRLLEGEELSADDARYAHSVKHENAVLDSVSRRDWNKLVSDAPLSAFPKGKVKRRPPFRLLDAMRDRFKRGDAG